MKHANTSYSNIRLPDCLCATGTAVLAFLTLLALPVGAATVLNPNFENPTLANDGDFNGEDADTSWIHFAGGGPGGGVYNPPEEFFTNASGTGTPTGANGTNVYSTNAGTTLDSYFGAYQEITDTQLTGGTTYTLTVAVGDYKTLTPGNWHLAISTSSMNLGTYLIDLSGSASSLTNDQFKDFSVSYAATGSESQIGENLKITFWGQNDGGGEEYVPFDNVRVDVVPEPSTALLGILGSLFLVRRRRK